MQESSKNGDIQVLRGVAVSMVVLQHYRGRLPTPDVYYDIFQYVAFWGGVDLFFVISGCVIMMSLIGKDSDGVAFGADGWRSFWVRRIYRLIPVAWFWLLMSLVLSLVLTSVANSDPRLVLNSVVAAALGVANGFWSYCVIGKMVGTTCPTGDMNSFYWSLSLEEQFYMVLSAMLLVASPRKIAGGGLLAAVALWAWSSPTQFSPSWSFRFLPLVLGVWVALLFGRGRTPFDRTPPFVRRAIMMSAIAAIGLSAAMLDLAVALPVMALAAMVAVVAAMSDGAWDEGVIGRAMRWLGERSYSLYLCHILTFLALREAAYRTLGADFVDSHSKKAFLVMFPLAIGCAVMLAHLSHRWIEEPWRKRGRSRAASLRPGRSISEALEVKG